jgi:hypothetical protein
MQQARSQMANNTCNPRKRMSLDQALLALDLSSSDNFDNNDSDWDSNYQPSDVEPSSELDSQDSDDEQAVDFFFF